MNHQLYLVSCFISFFVGFAFAFFNRQKKYKNILTKDLTFTERSIIAKLLKKKGVKL